MVRASKSSDKSTESSTKQEPVVAPTPAVVSAPAEKPKKQRAPKADKAAPVEVVPEPVVVAPVAPSSVDVVSEVAVSAEEDTTSSEPTTSSRLAKYGTHLKHVAEIVSSLRTEFKALEKSVSRDMKNAQKSSRKKKSSSNHQPSGFTIPTLISDELARFLGQEPGTKMSRTDVSKALDAYIKENLLQEETNKRNINADSKLSTLLNLKKDDKLSYFNLQRYMKHHFIKTAPAVAH